MSGSRVLRRVGDGGIGADVSAITPERLAGLDEDGIRDIPILVGGRTAPLGRAFALEGGSGPDVSFVGDLARVDGIGAELTGGTVRADGPVGDRAGASMRGGRLIVEGDVGHDLGIGMSGGALMVTGDAGDRAGGAGPGASRGMTGGEILVRGSCGAEAGARARRGVICIAGQAGARTGHEILAGTVVVLGSAGPEAGRRNRRGSLVVLGRVEPPVAYRWACTYRPPHVRLLLAYLRRRYRLEIDDRHLDGRYRRYAGDLGALGRGEILVWDGS